METIDTILRAALKSQYQAALRQLAEAVRYYQFQEATPWPPHTLPGHTPYSRDELLAYSQELGDELGRSVDTVRLDDPSGFFWLKVSKLELHLYNLRHLEHHTGQLVDRLRNAAGIAVDWIGKGQKG